MGRRMTVLAIVVGFVAVACGSSSSKPSATTVATAGGGATTTAAGGDPVAYANAQMVKWYAGTERALPTSSPAPQKGKNIWVISCGQAAEGCADPTNAIVDAGKLIGWNMTVFDGKLDPTLPSTGVRNAIAAKADGIILNVVDCQEVQQPLEEAHAAGIKIMGLHDLDCDDPSLGGKKHFDAGLDLGTDYPDYRTLLLAFGATKADWIISKVGAKANILEFRENDLLVVKYINDGFDAEIKAHCPGCTLNTQTFVLGDILTGKLTEKAQAALLQNPDANAAMIPDDSGLTFGIGAAIDGSGRKSKMMVMGGEGFKGNIENVREGKSQDAGTGYGFEWEGWASVDAMNRLLQNSPQVDCGCGFAVWDKDHNFPPPGQEYTPKADFKTNYMKIWGLTA
jgi:ribose transport system substrate-binding protein